MIFAQWRARRANRDPHRPTSRQDRGRGPASRALYANSACPTLTRAGSRWCAACRPGDARACQERRARRRSWRRNSPTAFFAISTSPCGKSALATSAFPNASREWRRPSTAATKPMAKVWTSRRASASLAALARNVYGAADVTLAPYAPATRRFRRAPPPRRLTTSRSRLSRAETSPFPRRLAAHGARLWLRMRPSHGPCGSIPFPPTASAMRSRPTKPNALRSPNSTVCRPSRA